MPQPSITEIYLKIACLKFHSNLNKNGQYDADIFRCILFNEKFYILFQISVKFITEGQVADIGSVNGLAPN